MKATFMTTLFIGLLALNSATAAQPVNDIQGKEKIGVVSVGGATTLDDLSAALERKAEEKGASAYKILSTSGNNKLHGVAEIYR